MRLNSKEPSITLAIKEAKISPSGSGEECGGKVAVNAGVQKKTKRYIEPSKKHDARPRVKMRRSVRMVRSTEFDGVVLLDEAEL
jgi:hypothetical protein